MSDLLFLVCVVPVLGLSFLRHDWWLGPTICTTGQATSNATTFCTFYGMVATAPLCHVAVIQPDTALSSGWGTCLLLCGATRFLGPHCLIAPPAVPASGSGSRRPQEPGPASCSQALLSPPATSPCLEPWPLCLVCWGWAALSVMWAGSCGHSLVAPWGELSGAPGKHRAYAYSAGSLCPNVGTLLCARLCGGHGGPVCHTSGFRGIQTAPSWPTPVVLSAPSSASTFPAPSRQGSRTSFVGPWQPGSPEV